MKRGEPDAGRTKQEIDDILAKKRYVEDDVDYNITEKKEEEDKWHKWVEKQMERVLFCVGFLTLIAAILTACCCYMFIELPDDIYGTHVLREIFLVHDPVITNNDFAKPLGIQSFTPLPLLVCLMYFFLLWVIYIIQYPKQGKVRQIVRYTAFISLEAYFLTCMAGYIIGTLNAEDRLEAYFKHDWKGLTGGTAKHSGQFHSLDHAQEYFGCCGFHHRSEWQEVNPSKYKADPMQIPPKQDEWPMSCCDEEKSGIACYRPVHLKVTYVPPAVDKKQPGVKVTKERLHQETCFEEEAMLVHVISSLVIILTFNYVVLSTWTLVVVSRIAIIVTKNNITITPAPQYVDSL